ncbi:MAG TPA: M23 family metallopeptidase [Thermoleophilaceae bacterium]|jgi:murein DD-endopeptidase MepM/ murein hydrolase activator NlpD
MQGQPNADARTRVLAGVSIVAGALSVGVTVAAGAGGEAVPRSGPDVPVVVADAASASGAVRVERDRDELAWPLHGEVTGRFGELRGGHEHAGIDIPRPVGTPIRAAGDGTVTMREEQDGYGRYTCVAHERFSSCYAHQSRFRVRDGARVRRGQVIGYVGDSGTSSSPHLHFEVRRGRRPWGRPVDPTRHLPRG